MHAALADLRDADDIALRSAAAQVDNCLGFRVRRSGFTISISAVRSAGSLHGAELDTLMSSSKCCVGGVLLPAMELRTAVFACRM